MSYASIEDVEKRRTKALSKSEKSVVEALLVDASLLIDAYNANATDEAKLVVTCNMIIRAIGSADSIPFGTTQGTTSALGYSQTFTVGNGGSVGELYLTRNDKKLLGYGRKIGFVSPFGGDDE